MWADETSLETTASAEAIWRLWADVHGWPDWNRDIDRIDIDGAFDRGSKISMTPAGPETRQLEIVDLADPEMFIAQADLGTITVRTTHRVEAIGNGHNRVTYRIEISGPAADTLGAQIGPEISSDFPEVLAALVERAESD